MEHPDIIYGKIPDASGVESWVFIDPDGSQVIKINSGVHYPDWLSFFFRILAHNIYFPQTAYDLIGFTLREDQLAVILKQPLIAIQRSATPEEIEKDLEARGFQFNGINDAMDEAYGVVLRDMHQENVVIADNGNVSYIDPIIQFTVDSRFLKGVWELF